MYSAGSVLGGNWVGILMQNSLWQHWIWLYQIARIWAFPTSFIILTREFNTPHGSMLTDSKKTASKSA
jgi:hypothetical protein